MIKEVGRDDIESLENRLKTVANRAQVLRERMVTDGVVAFPAQPGTLLHYLKEMERYAMNLEHAYAKSKLG